MKTTEKQKEVLSTSTWQKLSKYSKNFRGGGWVERGGGVLNWRTAFLKGPLLRGKGKLISGGLITVRKHKTFQAAARCVSYLVNNQKMHSKNTRRMPTIYQYRTYCFLNTVAFSKKHKNTYVNTLLSLSISIINRET